MSNKKSRFVPWFISLLVLAALLLAATPASLLQAEAATSAKSGLKLKLGDYIQFGKYAGSPILWRVINVNPDGSFVVYSEKVLCLKAFDAFGDPPTGRADEERKTNGSNYWSTSSLREWLNSTDKTVAYSGQLPDTTHVTKGNAYDAEAGFLSNFTLAESAAIQPVTHKTILSDADKSLANGGTELQKYAPDLSAVVQNYAKAFYENVKDNVFVLDEKEMHDYVFARKWEYRRMPAPSAVAGSTIKDANVISAGKFLQYWTRSPNVGSKTNLFCIKQNSTVTTNYASNGAGGVVPAMNLKANAAVKSGSGTAAKPYVVVGGNATVSLYKLPIKARTVANLPAYRLNYLLKGDAGQATDSTNDSPFAMNEQRFVVGRNSMGNPAYWDNAGNFQLLPANTGGFQGSDTANSINANNAVTASMGEAWPGLTEHPVYFFKENCLIPIRILDSGILVGNSYTGRFPAYFTDMHDQTATLMKLPKEWVPDITNYHPMQNGIQAVASNGASVGFVFLSKTEAALFYWSGITAEPIRMTLPPSVDIGAGDFFLVAGVNSKGEVIANVLKANGDNAGAFYYANPQSAPIQLSDLPDKPATKFATVSGINDLGDIVGNGSLNATLWRNKIPYSITDLTTMSKTKDEHFNYPLAINNNGDILLLYTGAYPIQCHAVISCKP